MAEYLELTLAHRLQEASASKDDLGGKLRKMAEEAGGEFMDLGLLKPFFTGIEDDVVLPKGRYNVNFDMTVLEKGRLTIEPGTQIQFSIGGSLQVYGSLYAVGGRGNRIFFHGMYDNIWDRISFDEKAFPRSRFEYIWFLFGSVRGTVSEDINVKISSGFSNMAEHILITLKPLNYEGKMNYIYDNGETSYGYHLNAGELTPVELRKGEPDGLLLPHPITEKEMLSLF